MQGRFSANSRTRIAQTLAAVWLGGVVLPVSAEDWVYTVRPGDNLWDICARYVKSPDCWRQVADRNQVANPRQIPPGTRLNLPLEWLKARTAQAAVLEHEGDIDVLRRGVQNDTIRKGMLLTIGDEIVVREGTVLLRFGDGSELVVSPHSRVRMDTLTVYGDIGMADTRVRLDRGRARATVQPSRSGASRFHVITPAAVAAARGTEFRVTAEGNETLVMRTEVIAGEVNVGDEEFSQPVVAGQAVSAVVGQGVGEPIELLPAPQLTRPLPEAVSLFPFTLAWNALPGAQQYRLEMFKDNGQRNRFGEYVLDQAEVSFDFLEAGTYQLLLRGIDAQQFEGFDQVLTLQVAQPVVLDVPVLQARRNVQESPHTVYWRWDAEPQVPYYELAITTLCDGQTSTRYEQVKGGEFVSQHPGCTKVSAQVAPWVQGQHYARSEAVDMSLTKKTGLWSIIVIAATLVILAL